MIVGLGTDIVEIVRIGQMIERHGELFLQRVYTEAEIQYCQTKRGAIEHYAGRWAAKEAVMKTLGTGFTKGVGWTDIEVANMQSGQPIINLSGGAGKGLRHGHGNCHAAHSTPQGKRLMVREVRPLGTAGHRTCGRETASLFC